jgi:hypothetical protein
MDTGTEDLFWHLSYSIDTIAKALATVAEKQAATIERLTVPPPDRVEQMAKLLPELMQAIGMFRTPAPPPPPASMAERRVIAEYETARAQLELELAEKLEAARAAARDHTEEQPSTVNGTSGAY